MAICDCGKITIPKGSKYTNSSTYGTKLLVSGTSSVVVPPIVMWEPALCSHEDRINIFASSLADTDSIITNISYYDNFTVATVTGMTGMPVDRSNRKRVFGNNTYGYGISSNMCMAAVHAGLLNVGQTGLIKFTYLGEKDNFPSILSNNILSQSRPGYSECAVKLELITPPALPLTPIPVTTTTTTLEPILPFILDLDLHHDVDVKINNGESLITYATKIQTDIFPTSFELEFLGVSPQTFQHSIQIIIREFSTKEILATKVFGSTGQVVNVPIVDGKSKLVLDSFSILKQKNLKNQIIEIEIKSLCDNDFICCDKLPPFELINQVNKLIIFCPTTTTTTTTSTTSTTTTTTTPEPGPCLDDWPSFSNANTNVSYMSIENSDGVKWSNNLFDFLTYIFIGPNKSPIYFYKQGNSQNLIFNVDDVVDMITHNRNYDYMDGTYRIYKILEPQPNFYHYYIDCVLQPTTTSTTTTSSTTTSTTTTSTTPLPGPCFNNWPSNTEININTESLEIFGNSSSLTVSLYKPFGVGSEFKFFVGQGKTPIYFTKCAPTAGGFDDINDLPFIIGENITLSDPTNTSLPFLRGDYYIYNMQLVNDCIRTYIGCVPPTTTSTTTTSTTTTSTTTTTTTTTTTIAPCFDEIIPAGGKWIDLGDGYSGGQSLGVSKISDSSTTIYGTFYDGSLVYLKMDSEYNIYGFIINGKFDTFAINTYVLFHDYFDSIPDYILRIYQITDIAFTEFGTKYILGCTNYTTTTTTTTTPEPAGPCFDGWTDLVGLQRRGLSVQKYGSNVIYSGFGNSQIILNKYSVTINLIDYDIYYFTMIRTFAGNTDLPVFSIGDIIYMSGGTLSWETKVEGFYRITSISGSGKEIYYFVSCATFTTTSTTSTTCAPSCISAFSNKQLAIGSNQYTIPWITFIDTSSFETTVPDSIIDFCTNSIYIDRYTFDLSPGEVELQSSYGINGNTYIGSIYNPDGFGFPATINFLCDGERPTTTTSTTTTTTTTTTTIGPCFDDWKTNLKSFEFDRSYAVSHLKTGVTYSFANDININIYLRNYDSYFSISLTVFNQLFDIGDIIYLYDPNNYASGLYTIDSILDSTGYIEYKLECTSYTTTTTTSTSTTSTTPCPDLVIIKKPLDPHSSVTFFVGDSEFLSKNYCYGQRVHEEFIARAMPLGINESNLTEEIAKNICYYWHFDSNLSDIITIDAETLDMYGAKIVDDKTWYFNGNKLIVDFINEFSDMFLDINVSVSIGYLNSEEIIECIQDVFPEQHFIVNGMCTTTTSTTSTTSTTTSTTTICPLDSMGRIGPHICQCLEWVDDIVDTSSIAGYWLIFDENDCIAQCGYIPLCFDCLPCENGKICSEFNEEAPPPFNCVTCFNSYFDCAQDVCEFLNNETYLAVKSNGIFISTTDYETIYCPVSTTSTTTTTTLAPITTTTTTTTTEPPCPQIVITTQPRDGLNQSEIQIVNSIPTLFKTYCPFEQVVQSFHVDRTLLTDIDPGLFAEKIVYHWLISDDYDYGVLHSMSNSDGRIFDPAVYGLEYGGKLWYKFADTLNLNFLNDFAPTLFLLNIRVEIGYLNNDGQIVCSVISNPLNFSLNLPLDCGITTTTSTTTTSTTTTSTTCPPIGCPSNISIANLPLSYDISWTASSNFGNFPDKQEYHIYIISPTKTNKFSLSILQQYNNFYLPFAEPVDGLATQISLTKVFLSSLRFSDNIDQLNFNVSAIDTDCGEFVCPPPTSPSTTTTTTTTVTPTGPTTTTTTTTTICPITRVGPHICECINQVVSTIPEQFRDTVINSYFVVFDDNNCILTCGIIPFCPDCILCDIVDSAFHGQFCVNVNQDLTAAPLPCEDCYDSYLDCAQDLCSLFPEELYNLIKSPNGLIISKFEYETLYCPPPPTTTTTTMPPKMPFIIRGEGSYISEDNGISWQDISSKLRGGKLAVIHNGPGSTSEIFANYYYPGDCGWIDTRRPFNDDLYIEQPIQQELVKSINYATEIGDYGLVGLGPDGFIDYFRPDIVKLSFGESNRFSTAATGGVWETIIQYRNLSGNPISYQQALNLAAFYNIPLESLVRGSSTRFLKCAVIGTQGFKRPANPDIPGDVPTWDPPPRIIFEDRRPVNNESNITWLFHNLNLDTFFGSIYNYTDVKKIEIGTDGNTAKVLVAGHVISINLFTGEQSIIFGPHTGPHYRTIQDFSGNYYATEGGLFYGSQKILDGKFTLVVLYDGQIIAAKFITFSGSIYDDEYMLMISKDGGQTFVARQIPTEARDLIFANLPDFSGCNPMGDRCTVCVNGRCLSRCLYGYSPDGLTSPNSLQQRTCADYNKYWRWYFLKDKDLSIDIGNPFCTDINGDGGDECYYPFCEKTSCIYIGLGRNTWKLVQGCYGYVRGERISVSDSEVCCKCPDTEGFSEDGEARWGGGLPQMYFNKDYLVEVPCVTYIPPTTTTTTTSSTTSCPTIEVWNRSLCSNKYTFQQDPPVASLSLVPHAYIWEDFKPDDRNYEWCQASFRVSRQIEINIKGDVPIFNGKYIIKWCDGADIDDPVCLVGNVDNFTVISRPSPLVGVEHFSINVPQSISVDGGPSYNYPSYINIRIKSSNFGQLNQPDVYLHAGFAIVLRFREKFSDWIIVDNANLAVQAYGLGVIVDYNDINTNGDPSVAPENACIGREIKLLHGYNNTIDGDSNLGYCFITEDLVKNPDGTFTSSNPQQWQDNIIPCSGSLIYSNRCRPALPCQSANPQACPPIKTIEQVVESYISFGVTMYSGTTDTCCTTDFVTRWDKYKPYCFGSPIKIDYGCGDVLSDNYVPPQDADFAKLEYWLIYPRENKYWPLIKSTPSDSTWLDTDDIPNYEDGSSLYIILKKFVYITDANELSNLVRQYVNENVRFIKVISTDGNGGSTPINDFYDLDPINPFAESVDLYWDYRCTGIPSYVVPILIYPSD